MRESHCLRDVESTFERHHLTRNIVSPWLSTSRATISHIRTVFVKSSSLGISIATAWDALPTRHVLLTLFPGPTLFILRVLLFLLPAFGASVVSGPASSSSAALASPRSISRQNRY